MTFHHRLRLTPEGAALDAKTTHRVLMRAMSHIRLDPDNPRADAALTYTRNGDTLDAYTRDDVTLVPQWQYGTVESSTPLELPAGPVSFQVTVARQYRPHLALDRTVELAAGVRATSRLTPVPADRLTQWATDLLARRGITANNFSVVSDPEGLHLSRRARREGIPTAVVTGTAESEQLSAVIADGGIGRGRNYGLGHIHINL